jgi:hypothetical protein
VFVCFDRMTSSASGYSSFRFSLRVVQRTIDAESIVSLSRSVANRNRCTTCQRFRLTNFVDLDLVRTEDNLELLESRLPPLSSPIRRTGQMRRFPS